MNHLQEAKDMIENKKGYDGQEEIISHALISMVEQLEIANTLKRIELESIEGLMVKQKDLPLWFEAGGG